MKSVNFRVNVYISMLVITIFGAGATMLILHFIERSEAYVMYSSVGRASAILDSL